MKYVFVSDIHGDYNRLIEGLVHKGFNPQTDTLVVLGDSFDRGLQSYEVLSYLMSLPHKYLVWGNHDLRLRDLILGRAVPNDADVHNGVLETLQSFTKNYHVKSIGLQIFFLKNNLELRDIYKMLCRFFDENVWCVHFKQRKLLAVHAGFGSLDYKDKLDPLAVDLWYSATWFYTPNYFNKNFSLPYNIIMGHWWASNLREMFDTYYAASYDHSYRKDVEWFELNRGEYTLIGIDNSNMLNEPILVWQMETDEIPKIIS